MKDYFSNISQRIKDWYLLRIELPLDKRRQRKCRPLYAQINIRHPDIQYKSLLYTRIEKKYLEAARRRVDRRLNSNIDMTLESRV